MKNLCKQNFSGLEQIVVKVNYQFPEEILNGLSIKLKL